MFLNLEKTGLWKIAAHSERRALQRLLLGWVALTLAACAGQQSQPQPRPPIAAESPAAQLQHWTINGKLGVRSPGENGSANLQWWQRTAQNYRIHLSGPLGAGTTVITGTPAGVTLQKGGEVPLQAATPAELTAEILGWPLPVAEMYYWVRGMAAPDAPVEGQQKGGQGQLQSLQQAGWNLNFSGYQNVGAYVLPTRIVAETRQAAGPVKVTLVIKEWLPQN
ncbi:lipoprotein insertase outer membrane protein LolB [Microbulbifer rhizosphaerae]|uniref:Outer-membrane lipoprotein LolB n=1 Tax=Microbulbifer rhizosphaerae TaxID=1562603 RepID=A0A7W4W919_9GAMM|nr:lipoprotein insertase outer membrane protein LolB [Microbulbifer rhizosphaerae]MBB3059333.1 outer membrane lipoprotein LolB [Microbulbifer rhizosphaerae]